MNRVGIGFAMICLAVGLGWPAWARAADTVRSAQILEETLRNRETLEPIADFYGLGALFPHASALRFVPTPEIVARWGELRPNLEGGGPEGDAALVLACGTWLIERDPARAIEILREVANAPASSASILMIQPDDEICPLRLNWERHFYLREVLTGRYVPTATLQGWERSVRLARETYIDHMAREPVLTSQIARVLLYTIAQREGLAADADPELLKAVWELLPAEELARVKARDRAAAFGENGTALMRPMRPAIAAGLLLMRHHEAEGDREAAIRIAADLTEAVSPDGFYWELNAAAGDLYLKQGDGELRSSAQRQYELALEGYLAEIEQIAREKASAGQSVPLGPWEETILRFKESIIGAGGSIQRDARELERIRRAMEDAREEREGKDAGEEPDQGLRIGPRLREVYSRQGAYADPAARLREVEILTRQCLEAGAAGTTEQRVSLAIGIVQLANAESDRAMREELLVRVTRLVRAPAENRSGTPSALGATVDPLLRQIEGEEEVAAGVPDPLANLSDLSEPELLYAWDRAADPSYDLSARRAVAKALANAEDPGLLGFFFDLLVDSSDDQLRRYAVRGIERILENAPIDETGRVLRQEQ